MTRLTCAGLLAGIAFVVPAMPASAQDTTTPQTPPSGEVERNIDEMKRTLDQLWDDVVTQMEPTIDRLMRNMETLDRVDDFGYYEDPEILENGDIIMRRKEDAPPLPPPGVDPEGGVDL
ncbi:MAG: hypothetical protein AAFS07_03895 [Pseudomonadota bacterium]